MNERSASAGRKLTSMNVLTIRNARKKFGQVAALDGATFNLQQGELLALLGPNGAGKTTLIRAIAGRVRLDSGEIQLFDRVLDGRHHHVITTFGGAVKTGARTRGCR